MRELAGNLLWMGIGVLLAAAFVVLFLFIDWLIPNKPVVSLASAITLAAVGVTLLLGSLAAWLLAGRVKA